jgi:hypothetical protein
MTTDLRVVCRRCGDVDVPIERGRLVVSMASTEPRTELQFECPRCATVGSATIDDRAATLLMTAGVTMVGSTAPRRTVREAPGSA